MAVSVCRHVSFCPLFRICQTASLQTVTIQSYPFLSHTPACACHIKTETSLQHTTRSTLHASAPGKRLNCHSFSVPGPDQSFDGCAKGLPKSRSQSTNLEERFHIAITQGAPLIKEQHQKLKHEDELYKKLILTVSHLRGWLQRARQKAEGAMSRCDSSFFNFL